MTKQKARKKQLRALEKMLAEMVATMSAGIPIHVVDPASAIYCNSEAFYNACVAGAECGYNRTTYDYACLKGIIDAQRDAEGNVPVIFVMEHYYKLGQPCEVHARVMLGTDYIFDIPMVYWNNLNGKERAELEKAVMEAGEPEIKQSIRL